MIEFRKADLNDLEAVLTARLDFLRDTGNIRHEEDARIVKDACRADFIASMTEGRFAEWLALEGERIVATSSVTYIALPPNAMNPSGKVGYIANVFTYPDYRRMGLATKLLALTVEEAKQSGCGKILLDATAMGRPLYERYGFKPSEGTMVYRP